jgi:transposase
MPLLDQLSDNQLERYYVGVDIGYAEHVAVAIRMTTFLQSDDQWKRSRCVHVPTTSAGFGQLQRYLDSFSTDCREFLGLCEPTGGYYGAAVYQYLLERGYPMMWVDNSVVKAMREKIFRRVPKTDELDARVMARIAYLHEAVGEEFALRPVVLATSDNSDLLSLCRDYWRLNTMINRARNQFSQLMAVVFPELKTFFTSSVSTVAPISLMAAYPTPADLADAEPESIRRILSDARVHHHAKRVIELQTLARQSAGLMPDPGRAWRMQWLTEFLLKNFELHAALKAEVTQRVKRRPDYHLLSELPYAGAITLATILAVTGDIRRFQNYRQYVAFTGYFPDVRTSQTINRTRMSKRGNRDLKRVLFQIAGPLVWFDQGDNPYKQLYERKVSDGRAWYQAMPFVCATLARHIYHCLKAEEPYDVYKAFHGQTPCPGDEREMLALELMLEDQFETIEAHLHHLQE